MNDVDRILATETDEPVPGALLARVMDAVRREARRPEPIDFPWPRFAVGLAAAFLTCALIAVEAPSLADWLRR